LPKREFLGVDEPKREFLEERAESEFELARVGSERESLREFLSLTKREQVKRLFGEMSKRSEV
jgi:hypothetical protein